MSTDLAAFLERFLNEDLAAARAQRVVRLKADAPAAPTVTLVPDEPDVLLLDDELFGDDVRIDAAAFWQQYGEIAPDPRVAELEAKLRSVGLHSGTALYVYTDDGTPACQTCGDGTVRAPCTTLRLLAVPYEGRPDFEDGWRV